MLDYERLNIMTKQSPFRDKHSCLGFGRVYRTNDRWMAGEISFPEHRRTMQNVPDATAMMEVSGNTENIHLSLTLNETFLTKVGQRTNAVSVELNKDNIVAFRDMLNEILGETNAA